MFSLIQQQANTLSLRDSKELKKISEGQANVAEVASHDSAAMRVIAVITTLFLPPTTTAVSFRQSGNAIKE